MGSSKQTGTQAPRSPRASTGNKGGGGLSCYFNLGTATRLRWRSEGKRNLLLLLTHISNGPAVTRWQHATLRKSYTQNRNHSHPGNALMVNFHTPGHTHNHAAREFPSLHKSRKRRQERFKECTRAVVAFNLGRCR